MTRRGRGPSRWSTIAVLIVIVVTAAVAAIIAVVAITVVSSLLGAFVQAQPFQRLFRKLERLHIAIFIRDRVRPSGLVIARDLATIPCIVQRPEHLNPPPDFALPEIDLFAAIVRHNLLGEGASRRRDQDAWYLILIIDPSRRPVRSAGWLLWRLALLRRRVLFSYLPGCPRGGYLRDDIVYSQLGELPFVCLNALEACMLVRRAHLCCRRSLLLANRGLLMSEILPRCHNGVVQSPIWTPESNRCGPISYLDARAIGDCATPRSQFYEQER